MKKAKNKDHHPARDAFGSRERVRVAAVVVQHCLEECISPRLVGPSRACDILAEVSEIGEPHVVAYYEKMDAKETVKFKRLWHVAFGGVDCD